MSAPVSTSAPSRIMLPRLGVYRLSVSPQGYGARMVMRLLWEPLPQSWPRVASERPGGLRGLLARIREMAAVVRHYDDFDRRMRREAVQMVVREAYQQTLAEQGRPGLESV